MKTVVIEWKHLSHNGRTCNRCGHTGQTLRKTIRQLNAECGIHGVRFRLKETLLPAHRLPESNVIVIDQRPIETLIPNAKVRKSRCPSCEEILGQPSHCRALATDGHLLEVPTAELIRAAACRVAPCHALSV